MRSALLLFTFALLTLGCKSSNAPAGWQTHSSGGVSLAVPGDWKRVEVDSEEMRQNLNRQFGSDPRFESAKSQAEKLAKSGVIKLILFAPKTADGKYQPNCQVIVNGIPANSNLEQLAEFNAGQLRPLMAPGTELKVSYMETPAGRIAKLSGAVQPPQGDKLATFVYIAIKDKTMAMASYGTVDSERAAFEKTADESAGTLRLD